MLRQVAKKLTDEPGIIWMSFFSLVKNAHLFLFIWCYYPISALSLFRGMKWIEMDYHEPKYWNEIGTDFPPYFTLIRIYVKCWMEKRKNRCSVHYIRYTYVLCIQNTYQFFVHWMGNSWLAMLLVNFHKTNWILTFTIHPYMIMAFVFSQYRTINCM